MQTHLTSHALALALAFAASLVAPAALQAAPDGRPKAPDPKAPAPQVPEPKAPAPEEPKAPEVQKEADRHFKSGVALFKDAKYTEALAEFERAYELSPHPLVLYNIAGCHRELLHYAEAVRNYQRFMIEGQGKVSASRLATAQAELDGLLTMIGRVIVTVTPATDAAALIVDGAPLDKPEMPLILPPGEHRLVARATGRRDAERTVVVGPGDKLAVELALGDLPLAPPGKVVTGVGVVRPQPASPSRPWLAVDAGMGMNLRRLGNTGAPSIGVGAELGPRIGVGLEVVLVAYAIVPSLRVRVAGDELSLHLVGAVPIAFSDDAMTGTFFAVAGGLGVRYRASPRLAFRLESYVSVAGKRQGTTLPAFLGGELWF
jgi:hypothetical protein